MTNLRQAAQQALEALQELDGLDTETECVTIDVGDVIDALRTALEKSEPPPEWETINNIISEYGLQAICFVAEFKAAQREWQGLTPDEVKHLYPYGRSIWGKETYEAIEKALKEKNT